MPILSWIIWTKPSSIMVNLWLNIVLLKLFKSFVMLKSSRRNKKRLPIITLSLLIRLVRKAMPFSRLPSGKLHIQVSVYAKKMLTLAKNLGPKLSNNTLKPSSVTIKMSDPTPTVPLVTWSWWLSTKLRRMLINVLNLIPLSVSKIVCVG